MRGRDLSLARSSRRWRSVQESQVGEVSSRRPADAAPIDVDEWALVAYNGWLTTLPGAGCCSGRRPVAIGGAVGDSEVSAGHRNSTPPQISKVANRLTARVKEEVRAPRGTAPRPAGPRGTLSWCPGRTGRLIGVPALVGRARAVWDGAGGVRRARRCVVEAIGATLGGASWQRCRAHYARNLATRVPKSAQRPGC
jgi:hypothetical protein